MPPKDHLLYYITICPDVLHFSRGPNGAGKSTTLRHIMGFGRPDAGTITINGLAAGGLALFVTDIEIFKHKSLPL